MSSTYSQELADSVSGSNEQECGQSRSAKSTRSAGACSPSIGQTCLATETSDQFNHYPQPVLSAVDSLASRSARRLEDDESLMIFGRKCSGSSDLQGQPTSSLRTSKKRQSPTRLRPSQGLVTQRTTAVYLGLIAGQTISEIVGGPLHTPTRKANFVAPSMQKWPSCRRFVAAFGGQRITPEQFEFLMGFPIGWTRLPPLEMPSSRKSPKQSGARSSRRKKQSET